MSSLHPYKDLRSYRFLVLLLAIFVAMTVAGRMATLENRIYVYYLILALMAAFVVVVGKGITGHWRGILIDSKNKISLSRLQMLAWSIVILSAIFTGMLANISANGQSPLDIVIPSQIWVLMGLSTTSLVASPAILSNKSKQTAASEELKEMETSTEIPRFAKGLVAANPDASDARWADLVMGEEVGNCTHVDLGKLQMLLFTFILVVSYGAAIAAMFRDAEVITELPAVEEGLNVLLGISHTGYLSNKAISHTKTAPQNATSLKAARAQETKLKSAAIKVAQKKEAERQAEAEVEAK